MSTAASADTTFTHYRSPQSFIRRFVTRRSFKSALIIGVALGLYMFSKASSFLTTYSTPAAREKLATNLGSNVGIEALLGVAHHIDTVAGYATWNFLALIAAGGAVWGLLLATKTFRGEEDSGRWELLLAGQTSARRATTNAILGLMSVLLIVYAFLALSAIKIGHLHGTNYTNHAALFFALALIAGMAEFVALGTLASQLMPVRSRASGLTAILFGIFYMIRLTADTTNAHWLLNLSPLGWIEKLQPLYGSQPAWLIPIALFILICFGLAIYFSGKRDLGTAIFSDKPSAKARTRLLRSPLGAALRLNRAYMIGWLAATAVIAFMYGQLAKGAANSFNQSHTFKKAISRLTHSSDTNIILAFMGITFLLVMVYAMYFAAGSIGRIRSDEAEGYIDNFLVRPVSRLRWLSGRVFLILVAIVLMGLITILTSWAGAALQHSGVGLHTLFGAGANAMVPAILVVGAGIFGFGFAPRLTVVFTYGIVVWSFLIAMLSSGLTLNHWFLDTSILHQISFAPAVAVNWTVNSVILGVAAVLAVAGALRFNSRDLQNE